MKNSRFREMLDKLNKTFSRRIGRRLSNHRKELLLNILPKYQFSYERFVLSTKKRKVLEIGFGMGEHLFYQVALNPDILYVGVEVYLNGVASLLKLGSQGNKDNLLIWANDLDMILKNIPNHSIDRVQILFPDPWHKRRYLKKRLVNRDRMNMFKSKLKLGGFIDFASDVKDYFEDVKKISIEDNQLSVNNNFYIPHEGYILTRYHQKAIKENRLVQFLQAKLITSY